MQNILDPESVGVSNLSFALRFILCMIVLRISILVIYKRSKVKKNLKTTLDKSWSSATLIDDTETVKQNLLEKLNHTNDLDEFLDTELELEALKYKSL